MISLGDLYLDSCSILGKMFFLECEKFHLLVNLTLVNSSSFSASILKRINFTLNITDLVFKLDFFVLKLFDRLKEILLSMLGLELFSQREGG